MPAAVTVPVPTRLASTYACQDMVEDLPQRISACEGRRSYSWGARPPPETERPANPGGVGVRGRRRQPRTCVLRARFLALAAHAVKGYSAFMVLGMNDLSTQLSGCFSVVPRGDRAFFASAPPRK